MTWPEKGQEIIIIGAGPVGLALALLLVKKMEKSIHKVSIYEKLGREIVEDSEPLV